MKKYFLVLFCFLYSAGLATGQEQVQPRKGQGYLFFAPGGIAEHGHNESLMHFGVGGEGVFYRGLGLGAEIGYIFPPRYAGGGAALASLNALYQFPRVGSSRKVVPFITGGVSGALAAEGGGGAFNFGGGVTYWLRRRLGLRLEFRDHILAEAPDAHLWQARVGISF